MFLADDSALDICTGYSCFLCMLIKETKFQIRSLSDQETRANNNKKNVLFFFFF